MAKSTAPPIILVEDVDQSPHLDKEQDATSGPHEGSSNLLDHSVEFAKGSSAGMSVSLQDG